MDPISIISAATAASKAVIWMSTGIYNFIDSTRNVDENVQGLQSEALTLNAILEAIKGSLSSQTQNGVQLRDQNPGLWSAILGPLQECNKTVSGFQASINAVEGHSRSVTRMISLKYRDDQLRSLRTQIRTHTTSLNLALQTINIYLSFRGPQIVTDDLGPRIDLVVDMMAQMAVCRDAGTALPQKQPMSTTHTPPTGIDILVNSARHVVVEANEAIGRSEAGSIYRNNMKPQTKARIEEWIELYESEAGSRAVDSSSTTSDDRWTPGTTLSGSSEEFEACLRVAEAAFERSEFIDAEKFFEKAILLRKTLSSTIQTALSLEDIYLKLAKCCFSQGKSKKAEDNLHRVRSGPTMLEKDAIRYSQATQLLAEIHLHSDNLEEAIMECRIALRGRKRIQGNETLGLLAAIMEAMGDHVAAETYNAMIPVKLRKFLPLQVIVGKLPAKNVPLINHTDKQKAVQVLEDDYFPTLQASGKGYDSREALFWACGDGEESGYRRRSLQAIVVHLLLVTT